MQVIIKNLFGKRDLNINFDKHINVLIGENGCGKSTILKMLDYISHRDFISLSKYYFDEIIICDEKNEDRIVRNDLLQLSFSNNQDFNIKFYKFTNDYLNKMEIHENQDLDEEFISFYKKLIDYFEPNYKLLELNSSINSEEYFKAYVYKDVEFLLNCDYEKDYKDRWFFQLPQSYLMTFFDSNKVVYGSKFYFKIIFVFMFSYIIALKKSKKVFYDDDIFVDYTCFKESFGTPHIENSNISGWRLEPQAMSRNPSPGYYVFCDKAHIILENTKYYDYVVFEEENDNISKQIKNIRFFKKNTLYLLLDKMMRILKEKIIHYEKQKQYLEVLTFHDINKICKIDDIKPTIRIILYEMKQLEGFYAFKYLGDDVFKHLKESFELLNDFDDWDDAIITKGYNYLGLFRYLKLNYERIIKSINSKEFLRFGRLSSKYMTNKIVDLNVEKLLIGDKPFIIRDKVTNEEIEYSFLSSGEKKIIRLILMMCFDKKDYKILLLDEPELSLSPYWQEMLLNDLDEYCKNLSIIIATQSPNLINENQLDWLIEVKKEG